MRMHELLGEIRQRQAAGDRVALATLVDVLRSAPRDPGAVMAICESGQLFGSISGGCVEAALAQEAAAVLRDGRARLVEYGLSDADAQAVGLSCGGTLSVLVEPLEQAESAAIERRLSSEALVAESMRLDDRGLGNRLFIFEDSTFGSLGNDRLDDVVVAEVRASIAGEATEIRGYGDEGEPHGDVRVFIHNVLAKPRMYIFGAIDFAHAMVRVAKLLGYEVTLCDARPAFATTDRFPEADRVIVAWPDDFLRGAPVDERTAIVALTHDEKFDIPLIRAALETNAGYIGVMGSRANQRTAPRAIARTRRDRTRNRALERADRARPGRAHARRDGDRDRVGDHRVAPRARRRAPRHRHRTAQRPLEVTAVVLAAGRSSRMGAQKLLMDVRGVPMIDRVLDVTRDYDTIVVSSPEVAPHIHSRPRIQIILNPKPDLGMAHSFEIANGAAPPENALLVFLGDKPLVTEALAKTIAENAITAGADVCFPERDGVGGHPVFFSPRARSRVETLSGDSLQSLRDDPELVRVPVPVEDNSAYDDVNDPAQLRTMNA